MRFYKLSLGVILMFFCTGVWAQGFVENALLFSRTKPGGSARIQAMGGSQIALGGDFSSGLSNPAGLGMYNRSEFTFSPALNFYNSSADLGNNTAKDSKTVFNIPGISYVHHNTLDRNGFVSGSFGVSMTRINDFHNNFLYNSTDNGSSIIDYFKYMAEGYAIDPLPNPYGDTPLLNYDYPEGMAYQTYLITPYSEDPENTNPVLPDDYVQYFSELDPLGTETRTLNRNGNIKLKGAQYQWSFAYGANFKDKLFLGASIGLTTLRYKFSTTYSESNFSFSESPSHNPLNSLTLNEDIEIEGSGVNVTLGAIYRFVDFAQVGVSLATPTWYSITDTYDARLRANWNIRPDQDAASYQPILSEYNFRTPMKISTGLAFFIGKYGLISGDLEFVNYSKAKYSSEIDGISFDLDNDDIRYYYTNVINYRIGAEARIGIGRLRAGYNLQNNPYKSAIDAGSNVSTISFGGGIKLKKFFIDTAILSTSYESSYSQYNISGRSDNPVALLKNKMTSGMLTVGFNF